MAGKALTESGEELSERELEILRYIADGRSNQQIADALVVTLNTVRWYNKQIYSKLGVHTRTLAIARATALGLLGGMDSQHQEPRRHNLPVQTTPFIGRQAEQFAINERLDHPNCHLL